MSVRRIRKMKWYTLTPNFQAIDFTDDSLDKKTFKRTRNIRYIIDYEKKELFFVYSEMGIFRGDSIIFTPTKLKKNISLVQDIEPNHFCEEIGIGRDKGTIHLDDKKMFKFIDPSNLSSYLEYVNDTFERKEVYASGADLVKICFRMAKGNKIVEVSARRRKDFHRCNLCFDFKHFTASAEIRGEEMVKDIDGKYLC